MRGGGLGGRQEIVQNDAFFFFVGKATTIKFWKGNFYSREILLSWRRLPYAVRCFFLLSWLVFSTYGWNSVWSFLLTVEKIRFGLFCLRWKFRFGLVYLWVPHVRKLGLVFSAYVGENQKGTEGRGREKSVTTICDRRHDNLRHVTTICDILWQFPSLYSIESLTLNVINRHKIRHKMSRQLATIYDIFCPVPFLPSPFGFRRLRFLSSGNLVWSSLLTVPPP